MFLYPKTLFEKIGFESIRFETLKYIKTASGGERIRNMEPSHDMIRVHLDLELISEMMVLINVDDPLPLSVIPDIRKALKKSRIERNIIDNDSILNIGKLCKDSRLTYSYFKSRAEQYPNINSIARNLATHKKLEELIDKTLTDQGEIKDSASNELRTIRRQLIQRKSDVRGVLNRIARQAAKDKMTTEEGLTIRNGRMVIPIKAEHKRHLSGFVHDVSATGQTVYIEPSEALNLNNDIRQLEIEENREIERILRYLTAQIGLESAELQQNFEYLGDIDALHAKAELSNFLNGDIPALSENGDIVLHDALNPILLLKAKHDEKLSRQDVVPLTLELNSEERCLIITGPNAGGKSVAMKTLGLCVLMLQSGYAIPAEPDSELPVFRGLYVDLGDDQSIENDLSTFSSRLTWMRDTHSKLEPDSLVLIDEAASGTDPEEGSALYESFIEELIEKKARIIVTTHHGSLKVFAHNHPSVINGSMEFDQQHLSPTYRFKKGLPGSSYAFEIAARLGLDTDLLNKARQHLGESKNTLEALILEMEQKMQEAESLRRESLALKKEAETKRHQFEEKRQKIIKEQNKIREKALNEARDIILNANRQIEEAVHQIKTQQAEKGTIKEARQKVKDYRGSIDEELEVLEKKREPKNAKEPPQEGDVIRLKDGKSTGELLEVKGNNAVVLVNGMRIKTKYKNLVKVKQPKKKNKEPKVKVSTYDSGSTIRPTSMTLDLRGYRGEAAVKEVTQFIDKAIMSNLSKLEIIHGKGEGILKNLIHDYLSKRPEVKHFELAPWDQGGPGCTIVEL